MLAHVRFVNAASLPYAKVDVDGNTLFAGRNGAGKTTILRAVLYFYGAFRSEQLGISRTKKQRFESYYFAASNSYLIYGFNNPYGRIMAFVYKSTGVRLKYRFARLPEDFNEQDFDALLFEGNIAKEPQALFNALVGANFELSPVLHSPKEYKNILYGQDRRLIVYSFFEANSAYEQIAKTISNIFINSKLDSGSIKRSLASSVSGFEPIDLEQMHKMLEAFSLQYEDIKAFERHMPHIQEAVDTLTLLEEQKNQINATLRRIHANAKAAYEGLAHRQALLESIEEKKRQAQSAFESKSEQFEAQKRRLDSEIAVIEARIKESDALEADYISRGIKEKLERYASRELIQAELEALKKERALLSQEFESVTQKYEALQAQYEEAFKEIKQELEAKLLEAERTYTQAYETLISDKSQSIEAFTETRQKSYESLQEELQAVRTELERIELEKERSKHQSFVGERLNRAQSAYEEAKQAHQSIQEKVELDKKELKLLVQTRHAKEQELEFSKERIAHNYNEVRKPLQKRLEYLNHELEHLGDALVGFLDESDLKHKNRLQSLLREEVLFSRNLEPELLEGESLLGLKLKWDALTWEPVSLKHLKAEQESLKEEIAALKKAYEKELEHGQKLLEAELKALLKNESYLREQVQANDLALQKSERFMLEQKELFLSVQKEQESLKERTLSALALQEEELKERLKEAEGNLAHFKSERAKEKAKLEHEFMEQAKALKLELALAQEAYRKHIALEQEAYELKLATLNREQNEALDTQGVDTTKLKSLQAQEKELEYKLESIEAIKEEVNTYFIDKKRLFDTQKERKEQLKGLKHELDGLYFEFAKDKKLYEEQLQSLKEEGRTYRREKEQFEEDVKEFEEFKRSRVYEELAFDLSQEAKPNEERLRDLSFAIMDLFGAQKDSLRKLQSKLQKVFDALSKNSSFNLERPSRDDDISMIVSARALQEFMAEDKLQTFKDEVAKLFTRTLHHIASETTALLKAESEVKKVVAKINKTLSDLQGIKVIEEVKLQAKESDDRLLQALKTVEQLALEVSPYAEDSLFASATKRSHKEVLKALDQLSRELLGDKREHLGVEDTFVLEFRAVENGHDTKWVPSLDGIGSNGTDVMVKAMVYIAMLSLARDQSSKKASSVYFHCILDEVGILAPNYLKELINYANSKQIRFINGAPDEKLVTTYKRLYMLSTNAKHQTQVRRLLSQV